MSNKKEETHNYIKRGNTLSRIGLIGSAIYIISVIAFLLYCLDVGWVIFEPLQLNQIGDLLAGIFGPLAIFWLVLGFFQQGEELRNSVNTLKLQAKELALSVEQQKELVAVTRDTLEHERAIAEQSMIKEINQLKPKPVVVMQKVFMMSISEHYSLVITNAGNGVADVHAHLSYANTTIRTFKFPFWDRGQRIEDGNISLDFATSRRELDLSIDYRSSQEYRVELLFKLYPSLMTSGGRPINAKLISERRYE